MDCKECLDQLYAYLDDEMDGAAATYLTQHLEACRPCYGRSQLERAFQKTLRARREAHAVPDGLQQRLRAALDQEDATRRPRSHGSPPPAPRLVVWAAAGAALFGLGLLTPRMLAAGTTADGSAGDVANPAQVHGRLTCLGCEIERCEHGSGALMRSAGAGEPLPAAAHVVSHLRTDDGRLWQLVVPAGRAGDALADHDVRGHEATVFGAAYPGLNAIRVARVHAD